MITRAVNRSPEEIIKAVMAVGFVVFSLEGSLQLLHAEAETETRFIEINSIALSLIIYLHTKHSGWNFLNIAVMQRPWERQSKYVQNIYCSLVTS